MSLWNWFTGKQEGGCDPVNGPVSVSIERAVKAAYGVPENREAVSNKRLYSSAGNTSPTPIPFSRRELTTARHSWKLPNGAHVVRGEWRDNGAYLVMNKPHGLSEELFRNAGYSVRITGEASLFVEGGRDFGPQGYLE